MLLNCHTSYSYRYGTLSIDALRQTIAANGYTRFALTDINNTSAWIETARQCLHTGLQMVPGIDFRNGVQQQYVGLARNTAGMYALNHHLSSCLQQKKAFEAQAPTSEHVHFIYPFASYRGWPLSENEWIGIPAADLSRLPFSPYRKMAHRMVVLQTLTFADKSHFNAHRLLRAIDQNTLLSKLPVTEQAVPANTICPMQQLEQAFAEWPVIVANTRRLLNDCHCTFSFEKFSGKNLRYYTGTATGDLEKLRTECEAMLSYRYGQASTTVYDRLQKELDIIARMNFASYFLINWDIVTYAKHKGYYHVGRGSGANSIVAYLLGITDVDPIELDLYFERFINPFRSNPPDFDIDFSWTDRDDITDYIFRTFNKRNNVALVGSYNTFQHDAILYQIITFTSKALVYRGFWF